MKKLLLILLCLPLISLAQQTYVPDDNFEAYLEANGMGNGVPNDDYVTTANINLVYTLSVTYDSISDLTGIEDFSSLHDLNVSGNQLTSLDVSQNTALWTLRCPGNQLASLDVSNHYSLWYLTCGGNQLTALNVSNDTALKYLSCGNNQLTTLDLSTNINLENLQIQLNRQLKSLNLKNGNYMNLTNITIMACDSLECVNVDSVLYATNNWWYILYYNDNAYFSENCYVVGVGEFHKDKELLRITDLLGRETKGKWNEPLFYIYDDGTVEKRITIE